LSGTEIFAAIVVTAILLAMAAVPFFRSWSRAVGEKEEDIELDLLLQEKERIYTVLADLDFDYAGRKISDEDYQKMRQEFVDEGVLILDKIERFKKGVPVEVGVTTSKVEERGVREASKVVSSEDVETEIEKYKKTRAKRGTTDIEEEIARFKKLRKAKKKR
jgi:hypothetical protein